MLKLLFDNRSGKKLELLVITFNEEKRIQNYFDCYGDEFDIVVLDESSTDNTADIVKSNNGTLFIREKCSVNCLPHIVFYINELSKSDICFLIMADEFVNKNVLRNVSDFLTKHKENSRVFGKRVDWEDGVKLFPNKTGDPRGFYKGTVSLDKYHLHATLSYEKKCSPPNTMFVQVHHFNLLNAAEFFIKMVNYCNIEVEQILKKKHSVLKLIKRVIVDEIKMVLSTLIRNPQRPVRAIVWTIFVNIMVASTLVAIFVQRKYMMSKEKHLEFYAQFFDGKKILK